MFSKSLMIPAPAIRVGGRRIPRSSRQRVLARTRVPVVHSKAYTGVVSDYDRVDFEWTCRWYEASSYDQEEAGETFITHDEVVSTTPPVAHTEAYEQHVRRWKDIDANRRRNPKKGRNNKDMRRHHRVNQPGFDTQRRPVK